MRSKKGATISKTFEPGSMFLEFKNLICVETSTGFEVRHHSKGRPGRKVAEVLDHDKWTERLQFFEPIPVGLFDEIRDLLEDSPFDRSLPLSV